MRFWIAALAVIILVTVLAVACGAESASEAPADNPGASVEFDVDKPKTPKKAPAGKKR